MSKNSQSSFLEYFCATFLITPHKKHDEQQQQQQIESNNSNNGGTCVHIPNYDTFDDSLFLEQGSLVVFERLQLSSDELNSSLTKLNLDKPVLKAAGLIGNAKQFNPLIYLYECYQRTAALQFSANQSIYLNNLRSVIIDQASIYLSQRDLYPYQSDTPILSQLLDAKYNQYDQQLLRDFLSAVSDDLYKRLEKDDAQFDNVLKIAYYCDLQRRARELTLDKQNDITQIIGYVRLLVSNAALGCAFIRLNSPWHNPEPRNQLAVMLGAAGIDLDTLDCLLGLLLSISCLPRPKDTKNTFFGDQTTTRVNSELSNYEQQLGLMIANIVKDMHELFLILLRQSDTRELALNWIGLVLHHFSHRAKLWPSITGRVEMSDGFILNLCHVLLLLCKPFSSPGSDKLLKVSGKYCSLKALDLKEINSAVTPMKAIHLRGLDQESYLVPRSEEENEDKENKTSTDAASNSFNFMTEIFFIAQKALQLGFKSTYDRFLNTMTEIAQFERQIEMISIRPEDQQLLQQAITKHMTKYLSMRTVLFQENFIEIIACFCLATCSWLTNLAMQKPNLSASDGLIDPSEFLKPVFIQADFEKANEISPFLKLIPEFIAENVNDFFIFVRRFIPQNIILGRLKYDSLMTYIMTFMGSPLKMKNPNLRAKLAEVLEELMPKEDPRLAMLGGNSHNCTELFEKHQFIKHLVPSLTHVFVSIELTGQSVAFEQKFQYRRSMCAVLRYLWTNKLIQKIHRDAMKQLAIDALNHLEDPLPPLFLRFINLLANDAIFLLDESLQSMSKLKKLQNEKRSGKWSSLRREEQQEKERDLMMTERLARFHNVMSKETINTLSFLTEEIKDIFCHDIMLDRIVNILNYFLMHLVGPKAGSFKVEDAQQYDFKPALIVFKICRIYANLGIQRNNNNSWREFCKAIKNDGRSYSPALLPSAVQVLRKTGNNREGLCDLITQIDKHVNEFIEEEKKDEINVNDVPDEFIDPIMQTLMTAPVRLPSNYIVDKSTIARHLLSDQTDPFTRAPLTMSMIKPEPELKARIDSFVKDYLEKKSLQEADPRNHLNTE